jgi:hypothetical protein
MKTVTIQRKYLWNGRLLSAIIDNQSQYSWKSLIINFQRLLIWRYKREINYYKKTGISSKLGIWQTYCLRKTTGILGKRTRKMDSQLEYSRQSDSESCRERQRQQNEENHKLWLWIFILCNKSFGIYSLHTNCPTLGRSPYHPGP